MNRRNFLTTAATAALAPTALLAHAGSERSMNRQPLQYAAPLRRGDTLGLVSPAGRVYDDSVYRTMEEALTDMGFNYRYAPHSRNEYGYLAGTDKERAADLNQFFADPDIDAVLAIRGGWGCNRILPHVNFDIIRENPKFFGGYSDITSLHLSILAKTGLVTYHSPNGTSDWTPFTRNSFLRMTGIEPFSRTLIPDSYPRRSFRTLQGGQVRGPLLGGNLTLICSLMGTGYLPDFSGSILFVEDIGEDVYRVDRMLSQLALGGILDQISGFVFGTCTDCRPTGRASLSLQQVLNDYFSEREIPSCFGLPFGHVSNNLTFPVGILATLDANEGQILLEETPYRSTLRG